MLSFIFDVHIIVFVLSPPPTLGFVHKFNVLAVAGATHAKPLLLATNAPPEGNAASLVLPLAVAFDNDLTASTREGDQISQLP